ncbi:C4-dicarboxylate ABC transporter permease (plasmid) [Neorhizobium sp. SOG26]|uniref:TRAP transporter large permease n=1 Tax=Neorhizobium sp. SOG26 TaxID=2060726 RepID=UPI000E587968|nr:TRAP transporter large permease [Neorhizobium sp. SOG26]AXV17865.1 C4-dicarboxylate ABC transporter permease [Neorhizobium sp. SOG26]
MNLGISAGVVTAGLLALLLLGIPIAYVLGLTGIFGLYSATGGSSAWIALTSGATMHLSSSSLLAIPLFMLMSAYITESGMGPKLLDFTDKWFSKMPGALYNAALAACGAFSTLSGSSVATAGAIGGVVIPEFQRRGLNVKRGMGAVAAGGTLGVLIPPSTGFIIYGELTETSVARLFMAGIVPGLAILTVFMIYTMIVSRAEERKAPFISQPDVTWVERWASLRQIWSAIVLMIAVLGGIFFGVVTPTEAAALGALSAMLIGVYVLKGLTWSGVHKAAVRSIYSITMIGTILLGGLILGRAITMLEISQDLVDLIQGAGQPGWMVMIWIMLLLLFLGMFLDGAAMTVITIPLLFPVITSYGYDPVWFAIIFVVNTEIGLLTPPVGMNLFIVKAISGQPMSDVVKGALPYTLLLVMMLIVLMIFPQISLWLPDLLLGPR